MLSVKHLLQGLEYEDVLYMHPGPCTRSNDSWEKFISVCRGDLLGMFCFVSTSQQGFLYDVTDTASLLTTYPYAAECIQVGSCSNVISCLKR